MVIKNTLKYHILLGAVIVLMGIFSRYIYLGSELFFSNIKPSRVLLKITFFITFFSIYAINYKVVCPKALSQKTKGAFLIAILVLIFVFSGIRYLLDEIIVYNIFGFHNYYEKTRVFGFYIFDNSYYAIQAILFSTLMYLFFKYVENKDKRHKIEMEHKRVVFDDQLSKLLDSVKSETIEHNFVSQINKKLTVKIGKTVSFLPINTITCILASGSYVDIKTIDRRYVLRASLDKTLNEIDDKGFVRIHRSTIININYIDKLIYSDHGEVDAKMKDGTLFRISSSYKKDFLKIIGL